MLNPIPQIIDVRMATVADAEGITEYLNILTREPNNNTRFRQSLIKPTAEKERETIRTLQASGNSSVFVAEDNGCIVGVLYAKGGSIPFTRHSVELSLNVHSAYRGHGLGTRLIEAALAWAQLTPGIRRVHLEVLARNWRAVQLYERLGFEVEGRLKQAYLMVDEDQPTYQDALLMARAL